jgi:hypothetical protein
MKRIFTVLKCSDKNEIGKKYHQTSPYAAIRQHAKQYFKNNNAAKTNSVVLQDTDENKYKYTIQKKIFIKISANDK